MPDINDTNNSRSTVIFGRNPVLEAIRSGREIDRLYVSHSAKSGSISEIIAKCSSKGILIKEISPQKLDYYCCGGNHQGVAVMIASHEYSTVEDILAFAEEKNEPPFIVLTDGIEDPHNLGAIIRTAECAGVHGIIIPKRGNVGVNATVHRSSAGACSHLRIARVANLSSTIRELKKTGIFVYCADMDGSDCYRTDLTGPVALVIGSEGFGISRLVKELCDASVSLPLFGEVNSLNASAAASALIYEIVRQKIDKGDINR